MSKKSSRPAAPQMSLDVGRVRVMLVREGGSANVEITSAGAAHEYLKPHAQGLDREHLWRIDLNARSFVIHHEVVSIGSLSASIVHPREVFRAAIVAAAAGVIVAHNHPSGDVTPSPEDKEATRRLVKAGELLGIPVVDHLIIGDGRYFSFKEAGLL